MDPDLKRARQLLRAERCPPEVVQRVRQTITEQRRQALYRRLAYACAILVALLASVASFKINRDHKIAERKQKQRVAQQASLSLAYLGHHLQETGNETGEKILRGALPGLIKGFRTASKAIQTEPEPKPNKPNTEVVEP